MKRLVKIIFGVLL